MPSTNIPGAKLELAPHVRNARYCCLVADSRGDEFQYIVGYEECDGRYKVARDSFPYMTLEMVVSGSGRLRLNGSSHGARPGFCFCFGPGVDYEFASDRADPIRKYFIVFGKTQDGKLASKKRLYPGFATPYAHPADIEKWSELIIGEGASQSPDALENVAALTSILVRRIIPKEKRALEQRGADALVIKALREIEQNFKTIASLQDLADALKVSSEHLCRVFKSNGKASPYRILTRRKMEHAYAELKMTSTPIAEIAHSLSYSDAFHFSRAFKKHYGSPPSAVR